MSRKQQEITFVNRFVDSVTVRPFFEGLRRVKQTSARFAMPPAGQTPVAAPSKAA